MKISKNSVLIMGTIFTLAGIGLMFVSAEEKDKILLIDPSNAIHHFEGVKVIGRPGDTNASATLKKMGNLVGISTKNNFVLSQTGDDLENNIAKGVKLSSILGGKSNVISGGENNTILGGESNKINAGKNSSILGGKSNVISGGDSVIFGGKDNEINSSYSSILGSERNIVVKNYSVAVGKNNMVRGDNSVAMGSGSKIVVGDGGRSFLWTDGKNSNTLSSTGVFVIDGEGGMVLGATKAHSLAKLTISGSLVLYDDKKNLACTDETKGVLKVIGGDSNNNYQKCFCSCDGTGWNALHEGARCSALCSNNTGLFAECGMITRDCSSIPYSYTGVSGTGACIKGNLIKGTGAFLVDTHSNKTNWIHRSCQTSYGQVTQCEQKLEGDGCPNIGGYTCQGNLPEHAEENNTNPPANGATRWHYDSGSTEPCTYKCNSRSDWNGERCVPRGVCTGTVPLYATTGTVPDSEKDLSENKEWKVIPHYAVNSGYKCAVLCDTGYTAVFSGSESEWRCAECLEGTQDPNNPDVCVTVSDCPDGYIRNNLGVCVLGGVCRDSDGVDYGGTGLTEKIGKITWNVSNIIPSSVEDYQLKCVDGDKYTGEVVPNRCVYRCQTGYYCNGYKCQKPQCRNLRTWGGAVDGGKYYEMEISNPGHYDFGIITNKILNFVLSDDITTAEQFHNEYRNKTGCYYWCPKDNRYQVVGSVLPWRCASTEYVISHKYKCAVQGQAGYIYLYGYGKKVSGYADVDKKPWTYYEGDLTGAIENGNSCVRNCTQGILLSGRRMLTKKDPIDRGYPKKLLLKSVNSRLCYKDCAAYGFYMADNGTCGRCEDWQKLDENQKGTTTIEGITYTQYRGCIHKDCDEGTRWSEQLRTCMVESINGVCPENWVSDGGNCYQCLSDIQHYEPGKGCVVNEGVSSGDEDNIECETDEDCEEGRECKGGKCLLVTPSDD